MPILSQSLLLLHSKKVSCGTRGIGPKTSFLCDLGWVPLLYCSSVSSFYGVDNNHNSSKDSAWQIIVSFLWAYLVNLLEARQSRVFWKRNGAALVSTRAGILYMHRMPCLRLELNSELGLWLFLESQLLWWLMQDNDHEFQASVGVRVNSGPVCVT